MTASDRDYMKDVESNFDAFATGVPAKSQAEADKILRWQCSTRDAFGNWHPVTLALSNVTVSAIGNILSNANFISQRLRELAKDLQQGQSVDHEELLRSADRVDSLRYLIYEKDRLDDEWKKNFQGVNIHRPLTTKTERRGDTNNHKRKDS